MTGKRTAESVLDDLREWRRNPRANNDDREAHKRLCARVYALWRLPPQQRTEIARLTADLADNLDGAGTITAFEIVDGLIRERSDDHVAPIAT